MEEIKRWEILKNCKAIIKGHFVFDSGRHGDTYLDKDAISKDPETLEGICWELAEEIGEKYNGIKVVVGPAEGAIKFSYEMARQLTEVYSKKVISVYTEEGPDRTQIFRRGFSKDLAGKKVLIVDDVLTTGRSIKEVIKAVKAAGGKVVAIAIMVARHKVRPEDFDNIPMVIWLDLELASWPEENCPLCKEQVSINTEHGHGKEFLERKNKE